MGEVVISVDAELGWGFHDRPSPPERRVERARWGWRTLADLFDEFDVPATWAVVGHLLLSECDGRHADHPAGESWFERERGAWASRPELRFAPELVERLREGPADHEIACHSFSHVEFGDPDTTQEIARAEIAASIAAARAHDVAFESFVFPRRSVGHRDVLAEWGFDCYRGRAPVEPGAGAKLLRTLRPGEPLLVTPDIDEYGLVDVPESLYLFGFEGVARTLAEAVIGDPILGEARRGIDAAATDDGVFHMWLHPNNVRSERDAERLRAILSYLDRRREDVTLATMAEVAGRTRAERAVASPTD